MESLCPGSTWSSWWPLRVGDAVRRCGAGPPHPRGHGGQRMYAKGVLAESNVQFVERARRVIEEYGKQVATPPRPAGFWA